MTEHDEQFDPRDRRLWQRAKAKPDSIGPCPDELTLAAYLDNLGSLMPAEAAAVEAHLFACPQCLRAVSELRDLLAAEPMIAPAEVTERARSLVAAPAESRPAQRRAGWLRSASRAARWAAAAAIVVGIGYGGFRVGSATSFPDGKPAQPAIATNRAEPAPAAQPDSSDIQTALVREATGGVADPADQAVLDGEDLLQLALAGGGQ